MPSYLVSMPWKKRLDKYLENEGPFPGPISNFELINHVFELQPHSDPSKSYMNKVIFPLI